MSDEIRDDLAVVREQLRLMIGSTDYALPIDSFQPSEHERLMLRRVADLAEIVERLAAKVDAAS